MIEKEIYNLVDQIMTALKGNGFTNEQDTKIRETIIETLLAFSKIPKKLRTKGMITRKEMALKMFDEGLSKNDVIRKLNLHEGNINNYYHAWRSAKNKYEAENRSETWWREQHPGLHDAMYKGLANGTIDPKIVRRNTWS